jgi:hypothetical protein
MCAVINEEAVCLPTSGKSADTIFTNFLQLANNGTTINSFSDKLFDIIKTYKSQIFMPILAPAGVPFLLSLLSMLLLKRYLRGPNQAAGIQRMRWWRLTMILGHCSLALAIASVLATNQTVGALKYTTSVVTDTTNIRINSTSAM